MLLLLIRLLLTTMTGILLLLLHYCCCHSSTTAAATRPPESDPQYRGWVSSRHEQTNGKRRPVTHTVSEPENTDGRSTRGIGGSFSSRYKEFMYESLVSTYTLSRSRYYERNMTPWYTVRGGTRSRRCFPIALRNIHSLIPGVSIPSINTLK